MSNLFLVSGVPRRMRYIPIIKVTYNLVDRILILKYKNHIKLLNDVLKLDNNLLIFSKDEVIVKTRLRALSKMQKVICSTEMMNLFVLKVLCEIYYPMNIKLKTNLPNVLIRCLMKYLDAIMS